MRQRFKGSMDVAHSCAYAAWDKVREALKTADGRRQVSQNV
jgi:hypothetical protein